MNDEQWKAKVLKITDPIEMLRTIVENEEFLGYDSYYKDLRATMLLQAERIVQNADKNSGSTDSG